MLRRLITLFALLTGLAAVGAPAQAAIYEGSAGVELASDSYRCAAEAAHSATRPVDGGTRVPPVRLGWQPRSDQRVTVPTVQLRVDRACE